MTDLSNALGDSQGLDQTGRFGNHNLVRSIIIYVSKTVRFDLTPGDCPRAPIIVPTQQYLYVPNQKKA